MHKHMLHWLVPHSCGCTMSQCNGVGTQGPTRTLSISKIWTTVWHLLQVHIDAIARWAASLVKARSPLTRHQTCNLSSFNYKTDDSSHLAMLARTHTTKTHTHYYCLYLHTHNTQAHTHTQLIHKHTTTRTHIYTHVQHFHCLLQAILLTPFLPSSMRAN